MHNYAMRCSHNSTHSMHQCLAHIYIWLGCGAAICSCHDNTVQHKLHVRIHIIIMTATKDVCNCLVGYLRENH